MAASVDAAPEPDTFAVLLSPAFLDAVGCPPRERELWRRWRMRPRSPTRLQRMRPWSPTRMRPRSLTRMRPSMRMWHSSKAGSSSPHPRFEQVHGFLVEGMIRCGGPIPLQDPHHLIAVEVQVLMRMLSPSGSESMASSLVRCSDGIACRAP